MMLCVKHQMEHKIIAKPAKDICVICALEEKVAELSNKCDELEAEIEGLEETVARYQIKLNMSGYEPAPYEDI